MATAIPSLFSVVGSIPGRAALFSLLLFCFPSLTSVDLAQVQSLAELTFFSLSLTLFFPSFFPPCFSTFFLHFIPLFPAFLLPHLFSSPIFLFFFFLYFSHLSFFLPFLFPFFLPFLFPFLLHFFLCFLLFFLMVSSLLFPSFLPFSFLLFLS